MSSQLNREPSPTNRAETDTYRFEVELNHVSGSWDCLDRQ